METLDRARALNALLPLPRLERMLRVYRTWVNLEGVGGGMALTRRELQCVLEFPTLDQHVGFLFDTFQCGKHPSTRNHLPPRVDLLTLLTTAAMLAQGALADRARFVFSLVDLDTEDDIVEAELALVISTCCNGLLRLRLLEKEEQMEEMDAMAVAYEAFDFVELEDGDKMTFAMFLKWCVFHPRPRGLLERVGCLFSACDAVRKMKEALEERRVRLDEDSFWHYNDMHFGSLDEQAGSVAVLVGPVVGKVSATAANVLMEVDKLATVKCFAFALPQEGSNMRNDCTVTTRECTLQPFRPALLTISSLSSGTTYVLRFLGIRKTDRNRCVAIITTKSAKSIPDTLSAFSNWRIRLLNHGHEEGLRSRTPRSYEAQIYKKTALAGYQNRRPLLTIHRGGIAISAQKVSAMLRILDNSRGKPPDQAIDEHVTEMIRRAYRNVLDEPGMWELLRSHSNCFLEDNESVLFSGFPGWGAKTRAKYTTTEEELLRLAFPVWKLYIESLWGIAQTRMNCLEIDDAVIFAPIMTQHNPQSEDGEVAFTTRISAILNEFPSSSVILLVTSTPLFIPTAPNTSAKHAGFDGSRSWRIIQEIVGWNLADLRRQIILLSFDDAGSRHTLLSVKNTTLSLMQLICGSLTISPSMAGNKEESVRPDTNPTDQLIIRHGILDRRPQYVQISSMRDVQEYESIVLAGKRRSSSAGEMPYVPFQAQFIPIQKQREAHEIVGPTIGSVSPRSARILIECDDDGEVTCIATDRLTLQKICVVRHVRAYRPATFVLTELTPGRTYDVSFQGLLTTGTGVLQTPHEHLPAYRLVIVSEDRYLDGSPNNYSDDADGTFTSYIENVSNNFFPLVGTFQADVTVHLGSIVALCHDLQRMYSLLNQDGSSTDLLRLTNMVRQCVRQHWNTQKTHQCFAHGTHWFPSLGVLRAFLTKEDIPVSFLRTVQRTLAEYEQVGDLRSHSMVPFEKYLYRLQKGVGVLMIDTLEEVLTSSELLGFVQLPETLLTETQWKALEYWLSPVGIQAGPSILVIMCDLPLISQRGEMGEMRQIWNRSLSREDGAASPSYLAQLGSVSWNLYSKEQARLLHLIFGRLQKQPTCQVIFVCSGAHASRTTITDNLRQLSFQQVVVGPISITKSAAWSVQAGAVHQMLSDGLAERYSLQHEIPEGATKAQQYCALELVPHPLGASSDVKFYIQKRSEARLILGPILGRITPRATRILIELDRAVPNLICHLTDSATPKTCSMQAQVAAFTPTILKVEGLKPGTRYTIRIEGLLESSDSVLGHVVTPTVASLTSEWLVVNFNSMVEFLTTKSTASQLASQWSQILRSGIGSYSAQLAGEASHRNGDSLGDHNDEDHPNFNPWHSIADRYLSEPLSSPQLLLHLGGQVDMTRAFTDEELSELVVRIAKEIESNQHYEDSEAFQQLRSELRHRMQEAYRVAWGVPPMKKILRYCSNLMLLNEDADLYFSRSILLNKLGADHRNAVSDGALQSVVGILRGLAFELWQLYQNQLWVDLAERDLKFGTKSSGNKAAFSTTFGINRMIVANVSHEAHEYCNAVEIDKNASKPVVQNLDKENSTLTVSLFSAASWKTIDEALEISSTTSEAGQMRAPPATPNNPVQQLVLVVSGDVMEWCGSKLFPALRPEIVKLFEKLFAWKIAVRARREVSVICRRSNGSSITYEVTDEKLGEKLTLSCIGSISERCELLHRDHKITKGAAPAKAKSAAISKGHFSRRFSYRSITSTSNLNSSAATTDPNLSVVGREKQPATSVELIRTAAHFRTFASYRFHTDYHRGFFDETLHFFPPRVNMPKAVVGPVIGRMVISDIPRVETEESLAKGDPGDPPKSYVTVSILLEINADARVVCVVTDILANEDVRVERYLKRDHPCVFQISSLVPERRYVYRFEGIGNSQSRRGAFHTPPNSSKVLNALAVSSNFPEQMDESTDSLWAAIGKRVQVSWCGFDMILHLGGQVPMHEAAFECFEWVHRELNDRKKAAKSNEADRFVISLRQKVRQRLQQRYHLCWNIPNVRETLAHTSNWFLRSQADVAPFFRNHMTLHTEAANIVLAEAKKVVADYQLSLMQQDADELVDATTEVLPTSEVPKILLPDHSEAKTPEQPEDNEKLAEMEPKSPAEERLKQPDEENQSDAEPSEEAAQNITCDDSAQFIQTGEVGIFVCDMRSTPQNDIVTCNDRLLSPLTQQERAVIGETQWMQLEKALKKKAVMVFVLCTELPLILTDASYVDAMREEATLSSVLDPVQEEATGRWKLYDRQTISQHWVSCRRQLEQLLNLLFRWKAKHHGRDVIVLSGGMRVGLETLLQDHETKLSVRNLTVGPLTARTMPDMDNMPLDGTACPAFLVSGSQNDERFTFAHSIVSNKNYLLIHAVINHEKAENPVDTGVPSTEITSASIETEFIMDDGTVDNVHPVNLYQRFPSWWANYVPMGKMVFWDDTVTMRAQSDEDLTALTRYLQDGREFNAALEVLFEKHQFAEAARMEELRSKHRRRQRGPEELRGSLRAVFTELWKVLPYTHRQRVAYFRDEFVFNFLLGYLAPELFEDDTPHDEDVERPPLEFAGFSTLCRDYVFNASVLHMCLRMQQEDELRTIARQRAKGRRQAAEQEAQRFLQEQQRLEEEAGLARLLQENPEAYAKLKLAEQESALQEKQAKAEAAREQRKAEKLQDVEEELAIAKEQRKLDKLAESGNDPHEFNRRRELLAARIRKLAERKRHRETEEARRRDKKAKKKKEKAAQQKEG